MPRRVDQNPKGSTVDSNAGALSDYEGLVAHFRDNNIDHFTRSEGAEHSSPPRQELIEALRDMAGTAHGRQILVHGRETGGRQRFVYDPAQRDPGYTLGDAINYNPAAMTDYQRGLLPKGDTPIPGDEHATATFPAVIDHEFGHTDLGRDTFGLPVIRGEEPYDNALGEYVLPYGAPPEEERRAIREFENQYRKARGLPLRKSYRHENDVYPLRGD